MKKFQTILVRFPNWVGDVVMAMPVLECLRGNYPESRIIAVIRKYARGVLEDNPWTQEIITGNDKTIADFWNLIRKIRSVKPDMAIVLPNSFRSALSIRLGGAKRIYGYRRGGRSFLLHGGPIPLRDSQGIVPLPMVEYYLEICRWLQLKIPENIHPRLFLSPALLEKGRQLLRQYGIGEEEKVIGLNPGAKFGSSKCWPPEYFSRLAELLYERWKCKLLLLVGPGEQEIAESILRQTRAPLINTGPDRVDLSLLKTLVQRCQLLVTNDTGPRHYAVALNIPVVVIMGPTDPRYTASNLEKTIVLRQELDCSPCHLKTCPSDHKCMRGIPPEDVLSSCEKLLKESVK